MEVLRKELGEVGRLQDGMFNAREGASEFNSGLGRTCGEVNPGKDA